MKCIFVSLLSGMWLLVRDAGKYDRQSYSGLFWFMPLCLLFFTSSCQTQVDLVSPSSDPILVQIGGEGSLSSSLASNLDVMFVRLDEKGGQLPAGYVGTGAQLLPATVKASNGELVFDPTQYYNPDGSTTRFIGWYPAHGEWNAGQRTVSFPVIDGITDIMATNATDGSLDEKFKNTPLPFYHVLTKVMLYAYVGDPAFVDHWGDLLSVELVDKAQTCTLTLPATSDAAGTAPAISFGEPDTDAGNLIFQKLDNSGPMAAATMTTTKPDPDVDTPLGYAMFAPHTDEDDVLTLKVTTELGEVQFIDVPYDELACQPGYAYDLIICFEPTAVKFTATITDWNKAEEYPDVELGVELVVPTLDGNSNCYMVKPGKSVKFFTVRPYSDPETSALRVGGTYDKGFYLEKLWEDAPVFNAANSGVSGIGSDAIITIKTNSGASGNAVVALKRKDTDDIVWSYHIWVTDYVPSGTGFMDRNLGATTNTAGVVSSSGLFYQWGRKDPFPKSTILTSAGGAEPTYWTRANQLESSSGTLATSIQKPAHFITNKTSWAGSDGTTSWNSSGGLKTVYDPCPSGYRVPVNGSWGSTDLLTAAALTEAGWLSAVTNYAQSHGSYGGVYPAAGYRSDNSCELNNVGACGYCWSANENSSTNGYSLGLFSITASPSCDYYKKCYGFSVRCLPE